MLSCWHSLTLADAHLWVGRVNDAQSLYSQLPATFSPQERLELAARLALLEGDSSKSLNILSPLLDNGDASIFAWELAIHALNDLGESAAASTLLQRAVTLYPHSNRILGDKFYMH